MFIAFNYLACAEEYRERLEFLLINRSRIIDLKPGFMGIKTLRPTRAGDPFVVVSQWEDQASFEAWRNSEDFGRMHEAALEDVERYRREGKEPPVRSTFRTYQLVGV